MSHSSGQTGPSATKPWLKVYETGVPQEVDLSTHPSLVELIESSLQRYRDRPAYSCMGKTLQYADLDKQSSSFGAYLTGVLKLTRGDRVAIMMPNVLQYPIVLLGILRAGLTVVNVNPLYTPRELEHQLVDSGAKAIIIVENFAHVLSQVISKTPVEHVITTGLGDLLGFPKSFLVNTVVKHVKKMVPAYDLPGSLPLKEALARGHNQTFLQHQVDHNDLAFLQYTGGTTGRSKGAMLTHGNMVANILQAGGWVKPYVKEGEEVIITALPLYHIFSLTANCLTFMKLGGHNILITNPRDIPGFVKTLSEYPFTAITGVNTLFNALLHNPEFLKLDFSHLRLTLGGGMAVQKAVAEEWKKVTGCVLAQAYGLSETSPAVTINPLSLAEFNGAIGVPLPSTDVSIRDDDGKELETGTPGELCVRGPQVMKGYWNRPDETEKVMIGEWFRTGDVAEMDPQGFFRIVDRKKDMILVSGFNVYPNEIEDVAAQHPDVVEVAAVGVPDEKSGEVVKLFVVRKSPNLTSKEVVDYCRKHLTGYKIPRQVEFREELPKTNVGKILRRALRDEDKTS